MKKIKTDYLSKMLFYIIIVGLIIVTGALLTLPWCMELVFRGTTFYGLVEHYKILTLLYITGVPAWIILWMTKGLAENIIQRDPFSYKSVRCLKVISICALFISICYLCACVFLQATFGIIIITIGSFLVALIAALLYRLVKLAIEIKEENELTI